MKNENNQQCEPCEQQFENNVDKIVNEIEGYTPSDHKARQKEVDSAFGTAAQSQHKEYKENGQSYGSGSKMQGQQNPASSDRKSGQPYGSDKNMDSSAQEQKTQPYGAAAQGQNNQKGQSYGSGQTAGAATQGQSGQWKESTPSNDKPYGNNGGTGSANGHSYGNPTDRHEHAKEGEEAYAGKHK